MNKSFLLVLLFLISSGLFGESYEDVKIKLASLPFCESYEDSVYAMKSSIASIVINLGKSTANKDEFMPLFRQAKLGIMDIEKRHQNKEEYKKAYWTLITNQVFHKFTDSLSSDAAKIFKDYPDAVDSKILYLISTVKHRIGEEDSSMFYLDMMKAFEIKEME
jgi:hypothetical protein